MRTVLYFMSEDRSVVMATAEWDLPAYPPKGYSVFLEGATVKELGLPGAAWKVITGAIPLPPPFDGEDFQKVYLEPEGVRSRERARLEMAKDLVRREAVVESAYPVRAGQPVAERRRETT